MIKCVCSVMDKFTAKSSWLQSAALLAARLWIAKVFFMSGLVKIKSWSSTIALFTDEYKIPVLPPEVAATMATAAELSLPVLLVLGLMTPLAALGLFVMTMVIELFIYPGTTDHYHWMLLLGILLTHGSGKFGADYWILKHFRTKALS
ncbi:MAG: DoxX family protein [Alphaproteobacteria bacterium]